MTGSPRLQSAPQPLRPSLPKAAKAAFDPDLNVTESMLRRIIDPCADMVWRRFTVQSDQFCLVVYLPSLVDDERLEKTLLGPLLSLPPQKRPASLLTQGALPSAQLQEAATYQDAVDGLLTGQVLLFLDGTALGFLIDFKQTAGRQPEEPLTEAVVRGPRDGFTETLRTNISLLRRRIRSSAFKTERLQIGSITKSEVIIAYLESIADPASVREVRRRLSRIKTDGVLESAYLEEFLEDDPLSPFPQVQNSERPDVVVSSLLEGRIAILLDGTPFTLIVPCTFLQLAQANEDYYERSRFSSALRLLRFSLLVLALVAPSLYIALTTFHQEMIPTNLLVTIAMSREGLPFPAFIEAMLMEVSFEALREAGVRLPRPVGQAVSIVGALVIGQAAIQAGIVSAPMVIVVAITGIASFAIPRYSLAASIRLLRFPLMFLGGTLGLFGANLGLTLIFVHLCSLRSFGVSYLEPVAPLVAADLKDALVRAPRWAMTRRPVAVARSTLRTPSGQRPHPPRYQP